MKILIAGNSQLTSLLRAYQKNMDSYPNASFDWICHPGGPGPCFGIQNGKLVVASKDIDPKLPVFGFGDSWDSATLNSYDLICISALGYFDGGLVSRSALLARQGVLLEFGPKNNPISNRPLTKTLAMHVMEDGLMHQPGISFLRTLRDNYPGPILVQPFPQLTEAVLDHDDWDLTRMYRDPAAAYRFFSKLRTLVLMRYTDMLSMRLLPYPYWFVTESGFTMRQHMQPDGIHPNDEYALAVIDQIIAFARDVIDTGHMG
jgi:hypothetical protein